MSEKISDYVTPVTNLAGGDLFDVSKLISSGPDVYESQKLDYSILLSQLQADLNLITGKIGRASCRERVSDYV